MAPNGPESQDPRFHLRVGGRDLPIEAAFDVFEIHVLQDVSAPGMFAIRMNNRDSDNLQVTWSDKDLFAVGAGVEIWLGDVDKAPPVMAGEITGLEPEFRAAGSLLTVRGYDRRHRLMRGRKTRSFTDTEDSKIAAQIAKEAHLESEVVKTQVALEYVLQHNQTDLEFLEARAGLLGFEVVVEDKTLKFRPPANDKAAVLTLTRNEILEFCPRLSTVGLAGKVEVRSWSPRDKEPVLGKAAAGSEGTAMGSATGGLAVADKAFGAAVAVAVDRPVQSRGEADQIAAGWLKEMALSYVTGEGTAIGCAALKAGTVVNIEGYGKRFSGPYYLDSVSHTYSSQRGYRTAFTVRRNATS